MMRTLLITLTLLCGASLASAQPRLPDEVLTVLAEECNARPGPMPSDRAFGDLLNAVAWRTRHLGIGLSRKTGGHRVGSPVGEIAEDILCDMATGHHWDVIGGAEVGRPLTCGGGPSIGIMRDPNRPCVAPVQPSGGSVGVVPPPPVVVINPAPQPPPVQVPDVAELTAQVAALSAQVAMLLDRANGIRAEAANAHESTYRLIAEVVIAEHLDDIKRRIDEVSKQLASQPKPSRWPW